MSSALPLDIETIKAVYQECLEAAVQDTVVAYQQGKLHYMFHDVTQILDGRLDKTTTVKKFGFSTVAELAGCGGTTSPYFDNVKFLDSGKGLVPVSSFLKVKANTSPSTALLSLFEEGAETLVDCKFSALLAQHLAFLKMCQRFKGEREGARIFDHIFSGLTLSMNFASAGLDWQLVDAHDDYIPFNPLGYFLDSLYVEQIERGDQAHFIGGGEQYDKKHPFNSASAFSVICTGENRYLSINFLKGATEEEIRRAAVGYHDRPTSETSLFLSHLSSAVMRVGVMNWSTALEAAQWSAIRASASAVEVEHSSITLEEIPGFRIHRVGKALHGKINVQRLNPTRVLHLLKNPESIPAAMKTFFSEKTEYRKKRERMDDTKTVELVLSTLRECFGPELTGRYLSDDRFTGEQGEMIFGSLFNEKDKNFLTRVFQELYKLTPEEHLHFSRVGDKYALYIRQESIPVFRDHFAAFVEKCLPMMQIFRSVFEELIDEDTMFALPTIRERGVLGILLTGPSAVVSAGASQRFIDVWMAALATKRPDLEPLQLEFSSLGNGTYGISLVGFSLNYLIAYDILSVFHSPNFTKHYPRITLGQAQGEDGTRSFTFSLPIKNEEHRVWLTGRWTKSGRPKEQLEFTPLEGGQFRLTIHGQRPPLAPIVPATVAPATTAPLSSSTPRLTP